MFSGAEKWWANWEWTSLSLRRFVLGRGGLKKKKGNSLSCKRHWAQPNCNLTIFLFLLKVYSGMRSVTIAILFTVWSWYDSRSGLKGAEYLRGLMEVTTVARETRSPCSMEGENGNVFAWKDVVLIPLKCFSKIFEHISFCLASC